MTYYGAKEIAASFRLVRKNTMTVAEEIPEDKFSFSATPETRTIAQTLVHIATATRMPLLIHAERKLTSLVGLDYFNLMAPIAAEEKKPRTKAEILDLLKTEGEKFASWVETVSEDYLAQTVSFPEGMQPPSKPRFEMLLGPKEHEMHHRSQVMLMQRMLGGVPHLTRAMNERIAQMQAAAAAKQ